MPTLYELTAEMAALMDSEDVTEEALQAAFGNIQLKAQGLCQFITILKGEIELFKAEEDRIEKRRKTMENVLDRVKEYARINMDAMGVNSIPAGTFTLSQQNNSQASLIPINESETPREYYKVVPATEEIDKERIRTDLEAKKPVPGWELKRGKHIRIR